VVSTDHLATGSTTTDAKTAYTVGMEHDSTDSMDLGTSAKSLVVGCYADECCF
jgi:hypothetical protein